MSPVTRANLDQKLALAKRCSREATLDGAKKAVASTVASAVPPLEQKLARAKQCSHEAAIAGLKAAVATAVCTAIPTFASVRMSKWARAANLGNPVAQTVIISYAAGMAYFIAGEKKVVELSRKHYLETAKDTSFKG